MESFEGRRVVVMGLGRFGGGVGVTRWLAERGADVLVTDREPEDRLEESVSKIRDLVRGGRVELRLGEHRVSDFTTYIIATGSTSRGCARSAAKRSWS